MNDKQKETLMKLFNEQQRINLETFKIELEKMGDNMDYKEEKMDLELSIHRSKNNLDIMKNGIKLEGFA